MLRALILVVLTASLTFVALGKPTVGPTIGRTAERDALFVEATSPRLSPLAMTIL